MWIEKRGRQHGISYRTGNPAGPKNPFMPSGSGNQAETFIELIRLSSRQGAWRWVRHDGTDRELSRPNASVRASDPSPRG